LAASKSGELTSANALESLVMLLKEALVVIQNMNLHGPPEKLSLNRIDELFKQIMGVLTQGPNLYTVPNKAHSLIDYFEFFAAKPSERLVKTARKETSSTVSIPFQWLTNKARILEPVVGVSWDFNVLEFSKQTPNCLLEIGYTLVLYPMKQLGADLLSTFNFLSAIQDMYQPNPYHNQVHGAMVAHSVSCLVSLLGLKSCMSPVEYVTLCIAALCHDVGHPGRNNNFFVNRGDDLSIIYNDLSVLENFHCYIMFNCSQNPSRNVFSFASPVELREIRHKIIDLVLETDMKRHFEALSKFRVRRSSTEFDFRNNYDDRWLVNRLCIKFADLGHSAVDWGQHFEWSCRVTDEFYRQGDKESLNSMTISPLCDRSRHCEMAKSQVGFLEFIVEPIIRELEAIDPESKIGDQCTRSILYNRYRWLDIDKSGKEVIIPDFIRQESAITLTHNGIQK